jgi:hypothetical protein
MSNNSNIRYKEIKINYPPIKKISDMLNNKWNSKLIFINKKLNNSKPKLKIWINHINKLKLITNKKYKHMIYLSNRNKTQFENYKVKIKY